MQTVAFALPEQVTLFAYSDLLLFTKEEEPGRCDVLRNPLYLQSVKLQEGKETCLGLSDAPLGASRPPSAVPVLCRRFLS